MSAETIFGVCVYSEDCGANLPVFQGSRGFFLAETLVICASVHFQNAAKRLNFMLKPERMYGVQPLSECGVNMAIAFFNIRFSSSKSALRF